MTHRLISLAIYGSIALALLSAALWAHSRWTTYDLKYVRRQQGAGQLTLAWHHLGLGSGDLTLGVGRETWTLAPADAAAFQPPLPRQYFNLPEGAADGFEASTIPAERARLFLTGTKAQDTSLGVVQYHMVSLPLALLVGLSLILPGMQSHRWLTRRRRHVSGLCPACGYDLTGNTSGKCPECGAAVEAKA